MRESSQHWGVASAENELIATGPYALARHPIYTGLLLGFVGSALAFGRWGGIVAVVLVGLALWPKLRLEEQGMRRLFGETYVSYEQRVKALIPLVL